MREIKKYINLVQVLKVDNNATWKTGLISKYEIRATFIKNYSS